jgi:hypothetical protein
MSDEPTDDGACITKNPEGQSIATDIYPAVSMRAHAGSSQKSGIIPMPGAENRAGEPSILLRRISV